MAQMGVAVHNIIVKPVVLMAYLNPDRIIRNPVGKETGETAHVERWNNTLRRQLARFVRKTLSFFKCLPMHEICLKLFLHRYNTELLPSVG